MTVKARLHAVLELPSEADRTARWLQLGLRTLIVANIAAVVAGTVPTVAAQWGRWLHGFEDVSVGVFTIEYLARVWTCVERPPYRHPFFGRLRYLASPLALIDLLAILPAYLTVVTVDLRFLRILRALRILRLLKLARYSEAMQILGAVAVRSRRELALSAFLALVLLLIAASLMYYVEREAQPDRFSSIPAAMWWAVATLTTVGYGDVYPVTPLGKVLGAAISVLGIAMFALPTGILGAAFANELARRRSEAARCPQCGALCEPAVVPEAEGGRPWGSDSGDGSG